MIKIFKKSLKYKFKYKSWNEVPISVSDDIGSVITNEDLGELDKEIKLLSILTGVDEETFWAMNINDLPEYTSKLSWLFKFNFPKNNPGKSLTIGDKKFRITSDLQDFCVSQYIDFQNLIHEWIEGDKSVYCNILAVFLIPDDKEYNIGYKASDVATFLNQNLSITKANQIFYFFLISLARSIRATEICYKAMMMLLRRRAKTKEEKEKMEILEQKTTELINQAQHIFGYLT